MTDISSRVRPEVCVAGGQDLHGLLVPLVSYLHALEATVAALERRSSAVPLMTAVAARAGQRGDNPARGAGRRALRCRLHWPLPGSAAMPSTPGLPLDHPRRHRPPRSPAAIGGEGPAMPSRRHGTRWAECRAPPRSEYALDTYDHVMDEPAEAAMHAAVDAIMRASQRPASRASGLDRIVGIMSASGSYDTMPSNGGRGATTGPRGCPVPPVLSSPLPPAPMPRFAGIICELGGLEGTKGIPDKEEVQVRVLDRPLSGTPCKDAVSAEAGSPAKPPRWERFAAVTRSWWPHRGPISYPDGAGRRAPASVGLSCC